MGCFARLGCLLVLAVLAVVGWFTRDRWLPARFLPHSAVVAKATVWEPLTDSGAERTRAALTKLSQPQGPVYQTLTGAEVAAFVAKEMVRQLPPSTDSIQAAVTGDKVSMRANVRMADIGGKGGLGPLASMLGDRETVQATGTFHVIKPGLAEFQVENLKLGNVGIPRGMIPRILSRFGGTRPAGLADDALPLPIPRYVGDIRVANGKITLYKNVE